MSFYGKESHQNEMNNISLKNVSDDQIESDHNTGIKENSNDTMSLESAASTRMENESIETKDEASQDGDEDSISVFTHATSNSFQDNSKSCAEKQVNQKQLFKCTSKIQKMQMHQILKRDMFFLLNKA